MSAKLIFDNLYPDVLLVPDEMGTPTPGQLQGTNWERLCELAGRVCYSSLGSEKSRDSGAYHKHILEVKHLSVYRHAMFTVEVNAMVPAETWLNRPNLWVCRNAVGDWRITLNLQHVIEWGRWTGSVSNATSLSSWTYYTGEKLCQLVATSLAPQIVTSALNYNLPGHPVKLVRPETEDERWLSFYISGISRGASHELVRHAAYCAPSQRSTRYCDESESAWAFHPLLKECDFKTDLWVNEVQSLARKAYDEVVKDLVGKGHSRKSARGAARGVLGNALSTEMIFSASLAQWRRILVQRDSPAADEEIRALAQDIGRQLPPPGSM